MLRSDGRPRSPRLRELLTHAAASWTPGSTTARRVHLSGIRVRVVIYPDAETALEHLREEDVGRVPCADPITPAVGNMVHNIRLMGDRLMIDAFTGQPIDAAGYESLNQFMMRWNEAWCPPTFEHLLDNGRKPSSAHLRGSGSPIVAVTHSECP